jgi:DNA-binding CsgD family transcriptional regulator
MKPSDIVRFNSKIDKSRGACGCWLWAASRDSHGYGSFWLAGRNVGAHTVAYALAFGASGAWVLHTCDAPRCCNPLHLVEGTHQQNTKHKTSRNRQARGLTHGCVKLTVAQVLAIRRDGRSQRAIAKEHGVSQWLVSAIKRRRKWAHV